ncbi:MAG: hypothetical protein LBE02_01815 [Spirochaetaceae bacterium]|jgi:hypothetical protein|nr:hypothetical protein [Spirochaetaceae bacterium]
MKRNTILAGTAVFVLAFVLGACGEVPGSVTPYTFRFKVANNTPNNYAGKSISKVEIFNGSNEYSPVLRTIASASPLGPGNLSVEYQVSGFTAPYQGDRRYVGARITDSDGYSYFDYYTFGPESKITISLKFDTWDSRYYAFLSTGNW